jgi:hypothetical protein
MRLSDSSLVEAAEKEPAVRILPPTAGSTSGTKSVTAVESNRRVRAFRRPGRR